MTDLSGPDAPTASYEAQLRVTCRDPRDAAALSGAIQVEAEDPLPRADVCVAGLDREAGVFLVTIRAEEPAYFRAALNSYLKWLQAADGGLEATRER